MSVVIVVVIVVIVVISSNWSISIIRFKTKWWCCCWCCSFEVVQIVKFFAQSTGMVFQNFFFNLLMVVFVSLLNNFFEFGGLFTVSVCVNSYGISNTVDWKCLMSKVVMSLCGGDAWLMLKRKQWIGEKNGGWNCAEKTLPKLDILTLFVH